MQRYTHTPIQYVQKSTGRHNHRHTGTYTHSYTTHSFIPIDLHISTKRLRERSWALQQGVATMSNEFVILSGGDKSFPLFVVN